MRTGPYLLCESVQFVVQVRCDAIVFGYQGDSGTRLLASQPEAVAQRRRQRPILLLLTYFSQTAENQSGGELTHPRKG